MPPRDRQPIGAQYLVRRSQVGRGVGYTLGAIAGIFLIGLIAFGILRAQALHAKEEEEGKKEENKKEKKKKRKKQMTKEEDCKCLYHNKCRQHHRKHRRHGHHHYYHPNGEAIFGKIRVRTGKGIHSHGHRYDHAVQPLHPLFPWPGSHQMGHHNHHGRRGMHGGRRCHHHPRHHGHGHGHGRRQATNGWGGEEIWAEGDAPPGTVPFIPRIRPIRARERPAMNVEREGRTIETPQQYRGQEPGQLVRDSRLPLNAKSIAGHKLMIRSPVLEVIALAFCCGRQ